MVASVASSVNSGDIARFDSFAFPHYRRCVCISYFILSYCRPLISTLSTIPIEVTTLYLLPLTFWFGSTTTFNTLFEAYLTDETKTSLFLLVSI